MKKNIDTQGRLIRLSLAIILLVCAYFYSSWIALIIALFVLFESLMSWCIIYHLLGKTSCPTKKQKRK